MATTVIVNCDGHNCMESYVRTDQNSFATIGVLLERAGWTHRDGKDFCPHGSHDAATGGKVIPIGHSAR